MSLKTGELLDLCSQWIEERGAAYLAKEDEVVYYTSHTGRKSDFLWFKLTLAEAVRTIQATRLTVDSNLTKPTLLTAFQEVERVFEFGAKSRHKMDSRIFNYLEEAKQDMGDIVMSTIVDELVSNNVVAAKLDDVYELTFLICHKLEHNMNLTDARELARKHFPIAGFEVRTGKYRPQVDGRKQPAVMLPHSRPRDIVHIDTKLLASKIYGELH